MRKIAAVLVVLILMVSISSLVLADEAGEDNGIDNETVKETEIMNTSLGAEIRLLQLKKALLKNILKGGMAVEVLKGLGYNTSELEVILSEMRVLLDEVKAVNASSNDSVQMFVELKIEAKNYTREFRETIRELLDDVKIRELRERIREIVSAEIQNYSKMIQIRIRQFNRNQLYRLYGIIGEANNSFVNEYLNGSVTLDQVKLQVCKMINQRTREERYGIFSEIKEENIKNRIQARVSVENMHNNGKGKGYGKNK
ncbi:MAG: hypothetical protein QHH19_04275 [Candidatus Thermoplasmatota archaeon]|jgi:hypothetical protein|nr:hypothetical protein [Candidatus Thermoplasmatota archaeon]